MLVSLLIVVTCGIAIWLAHRALEIRHHITSAVSLASETQQLVLAKDFRSATSLMVQVQSHTHDARKASTDPVWKLAGYLPILGENFAALTEVAQVAETMAERVGLPLVNTAERLSTKELMHTAGVINVAALTEASDVLSSAARTTESAHEQLGGINKQVLIPQLSRPLEEASSMMQKSNGQLHTFAEAFSILPSMLGAAEQRNYLVLVQNNAEVRATGGLPGALAVIRVDNGAVDLVAQASGSDLGRFTPPVQVDPEQEQIFSAKLGTYISDVNLTPHFPTVASSARTMWETRYKTPIDGVIAIDPVVLSHILGVSGPMPLTHPGVSASGETLPQTLTAENVVKTLLSDVYLLKENDEQDAFFAAAAQRVFVSISAGELPLEPLMEALSVSSAENRLHVWSRWSEEQVVLESLELGGSVQSGPHAGPNVFGAYFNDGTGAKMDYYVKRQVQLVQECRQSEPRHTTVRVTSTNTLLESSVAGLPTFVTGAGVHGVTPGSVQTNVVVYGPPDSTARTAAVDGAPTAFAPHRHGTRPVAVVALKLSPGETKTLDLSFQHRHDPETDLELLVTPTVQNIGEVILPIETSNCI